MGVVKKAWINIVFFVVTIVINTLGSLGLFNGLSQKEVSEMYPTLITPAPFAFGIWGIIYALLLASLIIMIVKNKDNYYSSAINNITLLFIISCIFNMVWIVAFSYLLMGFAVVLILGLAITLSLICKKLLKINDGKHFLLPLSFGLYAGWLLIASVVNIAVFLVKVKLNNIGMADDVWGIIILVFSIVLVIIVLSELKNAVIPLPVAWAYLGIYINLKSPEENIILQIVALVGMVILVAISGFQFYRNKLFILPKCKT